MIFNNIITNVNEMNSIIIDYYGNLLDCKNQTFYIILCDGVSDAIDVSKVKYNIFNQLDHSKTSYENSMEIMLRIEKYNNNILHMVTYDNIKYTIEIMNISDGKIFLQLGENCIQSVLDEREKLQSVMPSRSTSYNLLNVLGEEVKTNDLLPKVLVVDDSITTCKMLAKLLKTYWKMYDIDYETYPVGIFEKVIDVNEYDVVFIDIKMPVMDGYEVCRNLRNKGMKNTKFVAISANVDDDLISAVFSCGFDTFLPKPITKDKLLSTYNDLSTYKFKK
jgi:CheY-like chemotaxis protein